VIRPAALALALVATAGAARAEQLQVSLSTDSVKIDSNFTGATITVFGIITRDATTVSRPGGYQIAVVVRGPPETAVARRKDRFVAIWANGASETFTEVPSFYAVDTSAPLDQVAVQPLLSRYGIGFGNLAIPAENTSYRPEATAEFRDAYLRLKSQSLLYAERIGGVSFLADSVFRSNLLIPANVPVGRYTITAYLFSGGTLLASGGGSLDVSKEGFEQYMSTAARSQPFIYGLACIALALFTGWLAGVIFRRD